MPRVVTVDAAACVVSVFPATIVNDGVESATITVRVLNTDGNPMANMDASEIVIASTGSGNTITQPTGLTDANGEATGSIVSTVAAVKTISATVLSTAITDTASLTVSADVVPLGVGPNAPAWSSITTYTEQDFATPIPAAAPADAAGWYFLNGDYASSANYDPVRVTYPTAVTPIGTKAVYQANYPGQTETIDANGETSVWNARNDWSLKISGTWVGTLEFEVSNDGVNWSAQSMTARSGGAVTGSSTTGNGTWGWGTGASGRTFRVRASAWTSGSATIVLGMAGGFSSSRARAGTFTGSPTKLYQRYLVYISPTWDNGGNVGTKHFFFRGALPGTTNHYVGLADASGGTKRFYVGLQGGSGTDYVGADNTMPYGQWLDVEVVYIANTGTNADGTLQVWVDGVSVINETAVQFFGAADTHVWDYLQIDDTYGGGFAPPPSTADCYYQVAAWYFQTAP
jgi:hypothetical protein